MHITGKILAWTVAIGWVVALIFSGQMLNVRNHWMNKAQKQEKEFKENEAQLIVKRQALHDVRADLTREMLGWDRYWTGIDGTKMDMGDATISLGTEKGLTDKKLVYLFDVTGEGTYFGEYKVKTAREDRAALGPNWRVRVGDANELKDGKWRVRTMIPAYLQARFNDLEEKFLEADVLIVNEQQELDRQAKLIAAAEAHLKLRLGELNGFPELKDKQLPAESKDGLLTVIVQEEEARNVALREVDKLLRKLKKTTEEFERIRAENVQLSKTLPQPAKVAPAVDLGKR